MRLSIISLLFFGVFLTGHSQDYWQQHAYYFIDVNLDSEKHLLTGAMDISYKNNSPDTLTHAFFHLYFNAFQPGSMMDQRSCHIPDPDKRIYERIANLNPDEIGYCRIDAISIDNEPVDFEITETVMKVFFNKPLSPKSSILFHIEFTEQVPVQIRRSGRNNKEGIDYTMAQWYPKLAEYDRRGWHPIPYVAREFYGVWADYDVSITLDRKYIIGGTGIPKARIKMPGQKDKWVFEAKMVHDFAWCADPDYQHDSIEVDDEFMIHFYYQTDTLAEQWKEVQPEVVKIFKIANQVFGRYPYSRYSVVQGGDGGMEYPMSTFILGHGSKKGKVGLITHEGMHSWYYGVLANNEFLHAWMDEGMATYAEEFIMDSLYPNPNRFFMEFDYENYRRYTQSGAEEPMSTPSDFLETNLAYWGNAYVKGGITMNMLRYIIGDFAFYSGIKDYYYKWQFKHPEPNDFFKIMEEHSGLKLDWFQHRWLNTTHHIDYSISAVQKDGKSTLIELLKKGQFPMPINLEVTLKSGEKMRYHIPIEMTYGVKNLEDQTELLSIWPWTQSNYSTEIPIRTKDIVKIEIDPEHQLPDIYTQDNIYPQTSE
ncbi:MAG TPA: peptidase M1 [Flavobacteriales bacterium]|jgi:hypothetical protein|nr:peptidase M1 [Flavobacteriales bacterium]